MKIKDKEILSSCCAFTSEGAEEVHVLESDCPIKRPIGLRWNNEKAECTCILKSAFSGTYIPTCEHYQGYKQVQRNKERKFKVFCSALKQEV